MEPAVTLRLLEFFAELPNPEDLREVRQRVRIKCSNGTVLIAVAARYIPPDALDPESIEGITILAAVGTDPDHPLNGVWCLAQSEAGNIVVMHAKIERHLAAGVAADSVAMVVDDFTLQERQDASSPTTHRTGLARGRVRTSSRVRRGAYDH